MFQNRFTHYLTFSSLLFIGIHSVLFPIIKNKKYCFLNSSVNKQIVHIAYTPILKMVEYSILILNVYCWHYDQFISFSIFLVSKNILFIKNNNIIIRIILLNLPKENIDLILENVPILEIFSF